ADIECPDGVGVLRIGDDVLVVPRTPGKVVVVTEALPALAAVIRAVDSALLRLDDSVDAVGESGRDGNANLADGTGGQTLVAGNLPPGVAAIGGFIDATALTTTDKLVGIAAGSPGGGVHGTRVVGVDREVVDADVLVDVEDAIPGGAAIA